MYSVASVCADLQPTSPITIIADQTYADPPEYNDPDANPSSEASVEDMPAIEYVENYPTAKLKSNPLHDELYLGLSEHGIQQLAQDIEHSGLRNPLHILPNGTILDGQQRYRASKFLGLETVPVIILYGLAAKGELAIAEYIIHDHRLRKHLHPIEIARSCQCLLNLQLSQDNTATPPSESQSRTLLKQTIAEQFLISGRTLDRYLSTLNAPKAVQNACITGIISLSTAAKVGQLRPKTLAQFQTRLDAGEELLDLIDEYFPKKDADDDPQKVFLSLVRLLQRANDHLEGRFNEIDYTAEKVKQSRACITVAGYIFAELIARMDDAENQDIDLD